MVNIDPFNKSDRQAVRQMCCDVADRGGPIEGFFSDREIASDLLTGYYTDYEPESSFVAKLDGQPVGYINGCLDNRHYGLVIVFLIIPKLIIKGFLRGTFFQADFYRIFNAMIQNWPRMFTWRKKSFHSHQGHIHIGIAATARGIHVGRKLVEVFLEYAKNKNIKEVTASVHNENIAACRFFENLGFVEEGRYPMWMSYGQSLKEYHSIYYVKRIL